MLDHGKGLAQGIRSNPTAGPGEIGPPQPWNRLGTQSDIEPASDRIAIDEEHTIR